VPIWPTVQIPRQLGLVVSVALLLAVGAVGVQMNREALETSESIHRSDSAGLSVNNASLAGQYLLVSGKELLDFAERERLNLTSGDAADTRLLRELRTRSAFFDHGAALTDLTGAVLSSATSPAGLPAASDPGYEPLRRSLLKGELGVSGMMTVGNVPLFAVAVPVVDHGVPRALLIGYSRSTETQIQKYTLAGKPATGTIGFADSSGRVTLASEPGAIGGQLPASLVAASARGVPGRPAFVEHEADGRRMISLVTVVAPGGWMYFYTNSVDSFYGPVRNRSTMINLALLGLILVAAAALAVMNHRAATNRRRAEQRFRGLVHNAPDAILLLDRAAVVQYQSPSVARLIGLAEDKVHGRSAITLLHADDQPHAARLLAQLVTDPGGERRMQCRVRSDDGDYRWFDLCATNLLDEPSLGGIVINARDVTDSRELQDRLAFQAGHDALTELPNRRLFAERVGAALRRADDLLVAVLFVDLDRFKPINDRYGHDVGDEVLRQVAARLGTCLRTVDVVARVGGDEFVILLDGICGPEEAEAVAARAVRTMAEPFDVLGHRVHVNASIGVCLTGPGGQADEVLRSADVLMYRAKQAGGTGYVAGWAGAVTEPV
jgi:diguanylate cyclase (GGDEF)-like protein/PAS domain S-box-containing protein